MCKTFSFPGNHAVYEIMWKNSLEPDRPRMTVIRMRIACWIPKATNTYPEYVILIAFPQQEWLHERHSLLPHSTLTVVLLSFCVPTVRLVMTCYFSGV